MPVASFELQPAFCFRGGSATAIASKGFFAKNFLIFAASSAAEHAL
jgi:hypothetical protein